MIAHIGLRAKRASNIILLISELLHRIKKASRPTQNDSQSGWFILNASIDAAKLHEQSDPIESLREESRLLAKGQIVMVNFRDTDN